MTAPTEKVRRQTRDRDRLCVVANSSCFGGLQWNHREASGNGGRGSKAPKVTPADGVMMCAHHNALLESDGHFLRYGLMQGWKLKRNRLIASHEVPFWDNNRCQWRLPDIHGGAVEVSETEAIELIEAAGGYTKRTVVHSPAESLIPVVGRPDAAHRYETGGVIHRLIRADTFDAEPLKQEGRPADGVVQD